MLWLQGRPVGHQFSGLIRRQPEPVRESELMASITLNSSEISSNPIELIEQIVVAHDWPFDRFGEEELTVSVPGSWCEYHLCFSWRADYQAMQLSCAFDIRVPKERHPEIFDLVARANEQMWIGHFDIWVAQGVPMFRHTLLLRGGLGATSDQCEDLINIAVTESERFFPALQFVLWGGKTPQEAIATAMMEAVGNA